MIDSTKILDNCRILSKYLEDNKDTLWGILSKYEPYNVFEDELNKSVSVLNNIETELNNYTKSTVKISVFLPINLPIFSFIIYCFLPSFFCDELNVRIPVVMRNIFYYIYLHFKLSKALGNIHLRNVDRKSFVDKFVCDSDIVIFSGNPVNAHEVISHCKNESLFIFEGIGLNPSIIFGDANLKKATSDIVRVRTFNSGQDCGSTDSIFVFDEIYDSFLSILKERINAVEVGDYADKNIVVGKIHEKNAFLKAKNTIYAHKEHITLGGMVDDVKNIIYPTLIEYSVKEFLNFEELFSPIFFVVRFKHEEDLDLYFQDSRFLDNTMYVSIYGTSHYESKIKNSIILHDNQIIDIEDGNKPYGGYSKNSSFVKYRNYIEYRPILISEEIRKFLSTKI